MKVFYRFATGEITEVEVSEEVGAALNGLAHEQALRDRAETRRHTSLDVLLEDGMQFPDVEEAELEMIDSVDIHRAMKFLLPEQKELIDMVFHDHRSYTSIAREWNITERSVRERLHRALKRLRESL